MLIGGDDIRNEALPLARVFQCLFPLRADWRRSDSSVDGESGNHKGIGGGIDGGNSNSRGVVESSPSFSRPAARAPRRACSQATRGKVNTTELGYTYMLPGALTAKYCYGFSSFTFYKSQISGTADPRDGFYGFFVLLQNTLPTEFFSTN